MTDVTDTTAAELLRLGAELTLRMSIEQKIADLDVTEETDARFKAVREKSSALIARIATAPATTLAGLRVKARQSPGSTSTTGRRARWRTASSSCASS